MRKNKTLRGGLDTGRTGTDGGVGCELAKLLALKPLRKGIDRDGTPDKDLPSADRNAIARELRRHYKQLGL